MGKVTSLLAILCLAAVLPAAAQSTQPQSLADVARQLHEQRDKDAKKAAKVITNDNLPAPVPFEAVTVLPANPSNTPNPETPAAKPETSSETTKPTEAKPTTREGWKAKFSAARADLAKAKEMQQLSEDELNLLQIQQAQELDAALKADLGTKVQAKQSEVDVNKAATQAAQKALDDLEKDFKDSGAPADWSNTEPPKDKPS
jgi:hypothetical protein